MTVHRTVSTLHDDDVRTVGLLRVSSVPRMLVELSGREQPGELERLVTVAVQRGLLRLHTPSGLAGMEAALARHERWPGISALKSALAGYRRTEGKSNLEAAFADLLARHPEIPAPQRNVHVDVWEIDCLWPAHRLAVELDGRPYHVAVKDMERDRIKDAALQRLGYTPLRFTDFRLEHDRSGILTDLRHFLGDGGQPLSAFTS